MPLIKNTLVAVALLSVIVSMTVFIPSQAGMATFSVSASPYFANEGFSKILFGFYDSSSGAYGVTIERSEFASGTSVGANTGLISITPYANVSATRYSASPMLNTWINVSITNPSGVISYSSQQKVDSAYAYDSDDNLLGTGYQAGAEYYMVARTFSFTSIPLSQGVWLITMTVFTS